MGTRSRSTAVALAACLALAPGFARAADGDPSPENVKAATDHFKRARELYQDGSYKEALVELETAQSLDPTAKDLVYNLGILCEKLGRIDASIRWFSRYLDLDLDASERSKAEAFVKRLQGAKKLLPAPKDDEEATAKKALPPPPPPPPKGSTKLNVILIAGAAVGVAGIATGSYFGARALQDRPPSGAVTSEAYPYAALANAQSTAHSEAIIADVALGVGIASALTTIVLWAATRPRAPIYLSQVPSPPRIAPLMGSGQTGAAIAGSF